MMAMTLKPVVEARSVSKYFGRVVALEGVSFKVHKGEVVCLLGDNGAGKSTMIKIISGVYKPDEGRVLVNGTEVTLESPRDALAMGISTVYQDLAMLPLMSVARNMVAGLEPKKAWGPFKLYDKDRADAIARDGLARMGIELRDTDQLVGTLSLGERQSLAVARAELRGAEVLILDEPTSSLGVNEAAIVLRNVLRARDRGVAVVFISHNVLHALAVGDRFVVLRQGRLAGDFDRVELNQEQLLTLMGGGEALQHLTQELASRARR